MAGSFDKEALLEVLRRAPAPLTTEELLRLLQLRAGHRRPLRIALLELEDEGAVRAIPGNRWTALRRGTGAMLGRLDVTKKGCGFVRLEIPPGADRPPFSGDLFIPAESMGNALAGDLVRAELIRIDERGPLGRIRKVVDHANKRIAGWYQATRRGGRVMPRNTRIERDILTPPPAEELGVRDYDWVVVEITEFTDAPDSLRGKIVERLGDDATRGIDVLLLLRDRGIVEEFGPGAEADAAAIQIDWAREISRRVDLRGLPTFTIDPVSAKDFDDALSIEILPEGGWRLYVHIADVAHFVRTGTALDEEARERSTSVYPVDRVVPMLPHRLSSDLCSLRPGEDRLTMTAIMEIDRDGNTVRSTFAETVIQSDFRTHYEEIQQLLDGAEGALRDKYQSILGHLRELLKLTRLMRERRLARGALDLDIPELQVLFDEKGAVRDLKFYPRYASHQLIEECMLAANEAVAEELAKRTAPALYRIHEVADEDRLELLEPVLKAFGIRVNLRSGFTPKALQGAINQAAKLPGGHIVRRLILRALKRAEYSPRNVGHFGLASKCYCHFTSPIRRYPDVVVHRQLKDLLNGRTLSYETDGDLDGLGRHCSTQERSAQEAEWEAQKIKAIEFMKRHEGDEFDALIASVSANGIFAELQPLPVEGFAPIRTLRSDRYDLDELGVRLVGRRSGRVYQIGQRIRVQVMRADAVNQELELQVVEQEAGPSPSWRTRGRRR